MIVGMRKIKFGLKYNYLGVYIKKFHFCNIRLNKYQFY